jgi:hypothetical protein
MKFRFIRRSIGVRHMWTARNVPSPQNLVCQPCYYCLGEIRKCEVGVPSFRVKVISNFLNFGERA